MLGPGIQRTKDPDVKLGGLDKSQSTGPTGVVNSTHTRIGLLYFRSTVYSIPTHPSLRESFQSVFSNSPSRPFLFRYPVERVMLHGDGFQARGVSGDLGRQPAVGGRFSISQ